MNRKKVLLRYMLSSFLLFSFFAVGLGKSTVKAQTAGTVRYIRDSINGSTANNYCHWVELQAYAGGKNVALNKQVTGSAGAPSNLALATDGKWNLPGGDYYVDIGTGPAWIQVDLGQPYNLDYIRVWHYYSEGRTYHNVKTQVSADGINWTTVFDSETSGEYAESMAGHTVQMGKPDIAPLSSKGTGVRYIRDYTNGSTANRKDAWMEIAAYTQDGADVALEKNCTGDFEPYYGTQLVPDKDYPAVTDGDYTTGYDVCALSGLHYVQVDLGQTYSIAAIKVWHYYDDRYDDYRTYRANKTQVSTDGTNWLTVYDSDISGEYAEGASGHTVSLDISVTHPASVAFKVDPNSSTPFVDAEIPLKNNSDMPVKVYVQSLTDTSGGTLTLNNVPPSKYSDWSRLTAAQTRSDIAFGIRIKEKSPVSGGWQTIDQSGTVYTANMGKTLMGTLNAKGAGSMILTADCGLAWDRQYTVLKNLSLLFES